VGIAVSSALVLLFSLFLCFLGERQSKERRRKKERARV
jgi:hypothetical protein